MKLEFSRQIFENTEIWNNEKLSRGSRVVPRGRTDGQTDRHDEANSRLPQCCERKKKSWFNRSGDCMGHVARCEIILRKPDSVSDFFHIWYLTNYDLIARWWVIGPLTCCLTLVRNVTSRTLVLLGLQWSIYCVVIEFSFVVCYVEYNLLTCISSTSQVCQIPET
jgi:hypothetical protein